LKNVTKENQQRHKYYLLAGGGSGGHLYPGLSVAEALRKLEPEARILFLCTEREIDERIFKDQGWRYKKQPVQPIPPLRAGAIWRFWRDWRASVKMCERILADKQVAAVLGLGGFASGPAMKAAARYGVPTGMLNPDAVPGRANRFGMKYADRIFLQWQASRSFFGKYGSKCVVSGCPIRREFSGPHGKREEILRQWGLEPHKKTLLVVGGSQGGRNVNQAVVELAERAVQDGSVKAILTEWQVIHLTGQQDELWVRQRYELANQNVKVLAFTERMAEILPCVDLVIGRAGASTLAELTEVGVASILLPYPYHKDQHQMRNAEVLAEAGAAEIVVDDCDAASTARRLGVKLRECLTNEKKLKEMAAAARSLAQGDAAENVARELKIMAKEI